MEKKRNKFKENIDKLRLYIENIQKQSAEIPILKKMLDIADLNYIAYESYPGNDTPFDLNNSLINQGLDIYSHEIGVISPYQGINIEDAYLMTISGATGSYEEIRSYYVQSIEETEWKKDILNRYDNYIQSWQIERTIQDTFNELNDKKLLKEFDEMLELREKFRTDMVDHSAFANKTRNVLQHFKGIFKKAAQINLGETPSKERDLSWPKMAKAIIKNPKSSKQISAFKESGDKWRSSFSELSQILKDYSIEDKEKLIEISNEVLLILESFISLVDIEKLKTQNNIRTLSGLQDNINSE